MKTLIFWGSARANGRTREMLDLFLANTSSETEVIRAYQTKVSPCMDCRFCMKNFGCAIQDPMRDIYKKIEEADFILFITPVYFFGVPAPLKTIIDRMQRYWGERYQTGGTSPEIKKRAAIILAGGAPDIPDQFTAATLELRNAADHCGAEVLAELTMSDSDAKGVQDRPDLAEKIIELAKSV